MKRYNYIILTLFFALIAYASTDFLHGIVGLTKLNGDGCLCHSLDAEPSVHVSVVGPAQLTPNQVATYTIRVTGGPASIAGFNVAARFGVVNPADTSVRKIDSEITHNNPKPFVNDSVKWNFTYKAPPQPGSDTIYSVSLSANGDGTPSFLDKWNFGSNFAVTILNDVPVELSSFNANIVDGKISLRWRTESEKNNLGFEIQRADKNSEAWSVVGFVKGNGTSTTQNDYSFIDENGFGHFSYRLKQIDMSGEFAFSDAVDAENYFVETFSLQQNFPNPFNPTTKIKFRNSMEGNVILSVYNLNGEMIENIFNGKVKTGEVEVEWSASRLPSGVYLIQAAHSQLKSKNTIKAVLAK